MKTYLNADEKRRVLIASAAATAIGLVVEEYGDRADKQALADLKRAQSFVIRGLNRLMEGVDQRSREGVLKLGRGVTIGAVSDDRRLRSRHLEYVRYMRKVREEVYAEEGRDYVMDMAEQTLAHVCARCDGRGRDTCTLYAAYQRYQIEPWDLDHPRCEYAGAGGVQA